MDQDEFRATYREVNRLACEFEKSVLTNQCACRHARRFCIAEREGVACNSGSGHLRCSRALALLRQHARFALRGGTEAPRLAHGKAIRIQVGGMRGLRGLLDEEVEEASPVDDVDRILAGAEARYGALDTLPFDRIMPAIAAYRGRQRAGRRNKHRD